MKNIKELKQMLFDFSNDNTDNYIVNVRKMFDAKIISYKEHTVLKEFILDNKLENIKPTFYLFGTEAVDDYGKGGINLVLNNKKDYTRGYATFIFLEGVTKSIDFIEAFHDWMDYAIITKEEFEQL